MTTTKQATPPSCPPWAKEALAEILTVEIRLGNISPPSEQWSGQLYDDLVNRLAKEETGEIAVLEQKSHRLFQHVVHGLAREGASRENILQICNYYIPTGSRLSYCGLEDIEEVLTTSR